MSETINAILLGFVEGITEFLPISSSAHMILLRDALSFHGGNELAFDAVLQLAAAVAALVYFWKDIWQLTLTFFNVVLKKEVETKMKVLMYAIILGTIPAVFGGLLLEKFMETVFRNPLYVACALVAGSGLFAYAEYVFAIREREPLSVWSGTKVGFFQVLALVPGVSRSGATISGGLLLGLTRMEAIRFSFLLSIPILLGSGLKKFIEIVHAHDGVSLAALGAGSFVSFTVGLISIHFLLVFLRTNSLWPFIWYRLALAAVVVGSVFFA
jgi:undecaprenyl-diphosphatase